MADADTQAQPPAPAGTPPADTATTQAAQPEPVLTPAPAKVVDVPPEEREKYIRTMAKDIASLGGSSSPAPARNKKTEEKVSGVTLPTEEGSFFDRSSSQPKERPPETVALPSMAEASDIVSKSDPAAARENILARLRKNVSESSGMLLQQSPAPLTPPIDSPFETKNEWPDIPTPAPTFAPFQEAPKEVSRMPEIRKEPEAQSEPKSDPLHTYSSDFANRIDTRNANTFSVLAAEQDAHASSPPQTFSPRRTPVSKTILAVALGVLFLLVGAGGIFGVYRIVTSLKNTPIAPITVPSIVFADEYKELSGTGPDLVEALAGAATETLVQDNVLVTYVKESAIDDKGQAFSRPGDGSVLFRALKLPVPDILTRNVTTESTVGIVHAGNETRPFFALGVDSYERTYAGMLTWEPLMERDLELLYPLYPAPAPDPVTVSTTTSATTSPSIPVQPRALTRFTDAVVANHDVRVLYDTAGNTLIVYGYTPDKRTLVIVRNEAAFSLMLDRLAAKQ